MRICKGVISFRLLTLCKSKHYTQLFSYFSGSQMIDEYNNIDSTGSTYKLDKFQLESGDILYSPQIRYNTYGNLNSNRDNVIVVCHALTGNSRLDQWWGSMLGDGKVFDTSKYFIVCANVLGSCYGSTGPLSINPSTNLRYGMSFPKVTIRDSVRIHIDLLKNCIKVNSIACVIGGSMGGMQALEWAIIGQSFVRSCVIIACGAMHSAWQIAISETQRQAIYSDSNWNNGNIDYSNPPKQGLSIARQIAMISYRTASAYHQKFHRYIDNSTNEFQVKSYLEYQGKKFVDRFDPLSYIKITEQLDSHDISYNRTSINNALQMIKSSSLIIGIKSDILYPIYEQEELANGIPNSLFYILDSDEGHDGFLIEQDKISHVIIDFLNSIR